MWILPLTQSCLCGFCANTHTHRLRFCFNTANPLRSCYSTLHAQCDLWANKHGDRMLGEEKGHFFQGEHYSREWESVFPSHHQPFPLAFGLIICRHHEVERKMAVQLPTNINALIRLQTIYLSTAAIDPRRMHATSFYMIPSARSSCDMGIH